MRLLHCGLLVLACMLAGCQVHALGAPMAREMAPMEAENALGFAGEDTAGLQVGGLMPSQPARLDGSGIAPSDAMGRQGKLSEATEPTLTAAAGERMRIYQGSITVEVARRDDATAQFLSRVKEWGGYLSQQENDQLTVRIPAGRFDEAFSWLRGLGRVRSESKQASDVTDQYLDLGIRLDNAKKSRERLLVLLAKAEKVEDMLKIEEQLRRLTEEIERFEGQMKRLQDQVALATITARFVAPAAAPDRPGGRPSRFAWIRAVGAERMLEGF